VNVNSSDSKFLGESGRLKLTVSQGDDFISKFSVLLEILSAYIFFLFCPAKKYPVNT
jgi:hypothetical protein